MKIDTAIVVGDDFEQTRHPSRTRVREHQTLMPNGGAGAGRHVNYVVFRIGTREDSIDRIDKLNEARLLTIARVLQIHGKVGVNVRGIASEYDDAVGKDNPFFNVVSDDENRAARNFVAEPH